MRVYLRISVIALALILLLAACNRVGGNAVVPPENALSAINTQPPPPTPTLVTPEQGTGALRVEIPNIDVFWPGKSIPISIWAAPFIESKEKNGEGIFVLEPSVHPHDVEGANGVFQINNVPVGRYVLIVGPVPEDALAVHNKDGKPRVVEVKAGEVTDLGSVELER